MRILAFSLLALMNGVLLSATWADENNILGYDEASSALQREAEQKLDASIDAKEMDEWLRVMSSEPHHAGSEAGRKTVSTVLSRRAFMPAI